MIFFSKHTVQENSGAEITLNSERNNLMRYYFEDVLFYIES